MNINELIIEMEHLREKMVITANEKGIDHPDTIKVSQDLDKLLILYHKKI